MGMYDIINCKYALPVDRDTRKELVDVDFQTKDMDQNLHRYTILKDGTLVGEDGYKISKTGELEFYSNDIVFVAEFEDGELVGIKRVSFEERVF